MRPCVTLIRPSFSRGLRPQKTYPKIIKNIQFISFLNSKVSLQGKYHGFLSYIKESREHTRSRKVAEKDTSDQNLQQLIYVDLFYFDYMYIELYSNQTGTGILNLGLVGPCISSLKFQESHLEDQNSPLQQNQAKKVGLGLELITYIELMLYIGPAFILVFCAIIIHC